jgi:hypothetical protein
MVPVVAEGRREPLRTDHNNRPRSGRGPDLLFGNLSTENLMKSRHAAALALVVWYMIIPPSSGIRRQGYPRTNPAAPLSKWYFWNESWLHNPWGPADRAHAKEFDSKATCEAKKKEEIYPAHLPLGSLNGLGGTRAKGSKELESLVLTRFACLPTICVSRKSRLEVSPLARAVFFCN